MDNNLVRLTYNDKEIILIGTAHVSQESVEFVKKVIDEEKPDSICVELDENRYRNLQNPKGWEDTDFIQVIKSKKLGFLIASIILSSFQKKLATQLGTNVGQEMIEGIKSAKQTNAELVLADREIQVTFSRIWHKLGFWGKIKLLFSLVFSFSNDKDLTSKDVNDLLKEETLESVLSEVEESFPVISEVLIKERDQYLAYKIKNATGKKVVAILGGAHVPGVKEEIFKKQDIGRITEIPRGKPIAKTIIWSITAIIVGLLIYAFVLNIQTGLQQLSVWILWNSAMAALFTALVLGHPLTILTALVVAPLTSINPFLACGWFAGLVEISVRKPRVQDFKNVSQDVFGFKSFFRNRFLKAIAVVIMANIGSSIGTFVAGTNIINNLF